MMMKSPSAVNGPPQKGFCLLRTLFDSSALATLLTIGIFFGMIQTATSSVISSDSVASARTSLTNLTATLQTTTRATTVTSSSIISTSSPLIPSSYSGALSSTSGRFTRPGATVGTYYYQAIQVRVYTSGRYSFTSSSSMDTYGYFYSDTFDPSSPSQNLIASDDDSGGSGQFRINVTLSYANTYILVVTTYPPSTTGTFSVTGLGPASVSLTPMSPTTTTFSGSLTSYSQKFVRPGGSSSNYYFQAIEVTVYTSGTYTFVSVSNIDTYGCFYRNRVDPSYPNQNLIASDDDSAGDRQFSISVSLQVGTTYVLVVTTFSTYTTGSFLVRVTGPALVGLTAITPKPSYIGLDVVIIITIIAIGVIFFGIIFGLCLRRRNRRRTLNRVNVLPAQNQYVQPQIYSTTVPNMNQIPNPNSTTRLYGAYVEKPPPSYNSIITNTPPRP